MDAAAPAASAAGYHWRHPTSGRRSAQHPRTAVLRAKIDECRMYRRLGRAAECVPFLFLLSLSRPRVLGLVLFCSVPLPVFVSYSLSYSLSLLLSLSLSLFLSLSLLFSLSLSVCLFACLSVSLSTSFSRSFLPYFSLPLVLHCFECFFSSC